MARRVTFGRTRPKKAAGTAFNFGANVANAKPRKAKAVRPRKPRRRGGTGGGS